MIDQKPKGTFAKLMSTTSPQSLPTEDVHKPLEIKAETGEVMEKKPLPSQLSSREEKPRHINNDTMIPRNHATTQPRHHDTLTPQTENLILEVVRKAVKHIGKEAATHRFTLEEKNLLADIEYTFKRQGIKTSENEITRIAINYCIEDYRENGEKSILVEILKRLNS